MIPLVLDHIIFTGLWSILYLHLAYFSLLYYMCRGQIEHNTLVTFFESLSLPLRFGLHLPPRTFNDVHPLDGRSQWIRGWFDSLFLRLFFSLCAIFPTLAYSLYLVESNTITGAISAATGLVVALYLFVRSWYFGHKLKDMQNTADQSA